MRYCIENKYLPLKRFTSYISEILYLIRQDYLRCVQENSLTVNIFSEILCFILKLV